MTPTLSVAVRLEIGTVNELEVAGIVNPVTVGGVVSERVIVVVAFLLVETLFAASFAQAKRVFDPAVVKV
jgi:hypothetical protein